MATTQQQDTRTTGSAARTAVEALRAQRDEALAELGRLPDAELRYPAQWTSITRTVNFLLRSYSLHEIDHLQHAQRLLRERGVQLSEAQLILMKAQALRGELEALLLSLTDEQYEASGPGESWSVRQLVEHLADTDALYLRNARQALEAGRAGAGAPAP